MLEIGARYLQQDSTCSFRVWAPLLRRVEVKLLSPEQRIVPMQRDERGYWSAAVQDVAPGTRYVYRLDGERERPDPASRFQPEGVYGPSQVVDPVFPWQDGAWRGLPLAEHVIYE